MQVQEKSTDGKARNFIVENKLLERHSSAQINGRKLIYLDGTLVYAMQTMSSCWQSDSEFGVAEAIGKGPRFIIIHAFR